MSLIASRFYQGSNFVWTGLSRAFHEPHSIQIRNYAARKGTRARREKQKVKVEVEKVGFIPHNLRNKEKMLASRPKRKFDDSWKGTPVDDVYCTTYYKWVRYPFQEAVQNHKETHHPTMYNVPNANLHVSIELDMQGEKKTKFADNFTNTVAMPHPFDHGEERSIIVFSKTPEEQTSAIDAGAQLAGGVELIKQIQNGEVSLLDFHHVIAHPNILPELVPLRGVLKRKFPNPKNGTLNIELVKVVQRFLHGITYTALKDDYEKDFGSIETIIGTLEMDNKALEENFAALIQDVHSMKPRKTGDFIKRCVLTSPPSSEKLMVVFDEYISAGQAKNKEDEEEEPVGETVAL